MHGLDENSKLISAMVKIGICGNAGIDIQELEIPPGFAGCPF